MYAIFCFMSDAEFKDLTDDGGMKVHLFDSEGDALDWAIEVLIDKGDLMIRDGDYVLTEDYDGRGPLCEHYPTKALAFEAWQHTLAAMEFFHLAQVHDHREIGG